MRTARPSMIADRLNIWLDFPLGNTTGLETNATLRLGTASIVDFSTRCGASTAELADAWHVNGLQAKVGNRGI